MQEQTFLPCPALPFFEGSSVFPGTDDAVEEAGPLSTAIDCTKRRQSSSMDSSRLKS